MAYQMSDFFGANGQAPSEGGWGSRPDGTVDRGGSWATSGRGGSTPPGNYGRQGDDDDAFSYMPDIENPDPYAVEIDKRGYMYGGAAGRGESVAGANRSQGSLAAGQQFNGIDPSMANGSRQWQNLAANEYLNQMRGRAPSLAQAQMQQGLAASNASASGMAAGARGGGASLAAAQRAAIQQQGVNNSNATNAAAQLRAQEYQNAVNGLTGVSGQMRGMDEQRAQAQGQLELGQFGAKQGAAQGWERLAQTPELANLAASQNYEKDYREAEEAARARRFEQEKKNTEYAREDTGAFLGSMGKMFGGMF